MFWFHGLPVFVFILLHNIRTVPFAHIFDLAPSGLFLLFLAHEAFYSAFSSASSLLSLVAWQGCLIVLCSLLEWAVVHFFFFFFVHRSILSCAWPTFLLRFWSAFRGVSFMRLPRFVAVCVKYWCLWSLFSTYLSQFSLPLGVRNFFAKLTVVCSCIFVRFFRLLTCGCSSLVSVCAHMCCVLTRV